ncbi:F-box DNA helicase 1 [Hyperolius riggenbachi]|uniref:F-box DNA helicase 1 n=1 Tax=Hyperolius riggenbachi TaxID=752182 RepID=UPI0035A3B4FB
MKRQKRLTKWDCEDLAQSEEGSCSLTQPLNRWSSTRDVNKGLYPRNRTKRWCKGKSKTICGNSSSDSKSTDMLSSNSSHSPDMEEEEDALFSSLIEENPAMFDGVDWPHEHSSSRKRPFSCLENWKQGPNVKHSLGDDASSSSSFFEDANDDEMSHMLDSLSDSCYGLLGVTGDNNEQSCELLNQFPDELLQYIFGFVPMMDLCQNISLVCKKWKAIVDDELFIPWKKLYYRYVAKDPGATGNVTEILRKNGMISDEHYIMNLIKYFASLVHSRDRNFEKILNTCKWHGLYKTAEGAVAARFPELKDDSGNINPWAMIAVLVLLARGYRDIQKLIRCLQCPSSPLKLIEVLEACYCLALLVYAIREEKNSFPNSVHYFLFYNLYLLENGDTTYTFSSHTHCRNVPSFKLTNEQQRILNHDIQTGQVVKIMAFAGTGKTSTLVKYAESRPGLRFLYATFNKSITNHANNLFPANVTCKTFHSLAFQEFGKLYQQRNKLNPNSLTPYTVNFVLPEGQAGFVNAKLVVKTLGTFFASADDEIEVDHVPIRYINNQGEKQLVPRHLQQFAVRESSLIWRNMRSLQETKELAYKITHDGYLKLWQLNKPDLSSYDAIFVDEAQDCTPSIMAIVLSQTCGKIFVGDPHQQIYTFRGAVNALCEVPHTHIFYLTQSFRFGAEIAYIGDTILDVCKKIRNKTLVGGKQAGTVREPSQSNVAILCRSNSSVFDHAVRVTEGESPSRIHIIGGPENFGLNKILDIWTLLQPQSERQRLGYRFKDRFIASWEKRGFSALKKYAVSAEDVELEGKISIVEKYSFRIPQLLKRIQDCNTPFTSSADYILGTVHKAKGMEFDTVEITDDFVKVHFPRHTLERIQLPLTSVVEDEWNLLYVAVTRAKKHLVLSKSIENILTLAGQYFLTAELTSEVLKEGPVLCVLQHCKNPIPEQSILTMKKLPITYSNKSEDKGGYFCHTCVQQRLGAMTELMLAPEVLQTMDNKLETLNIPPHFELLLLVI